MRGVGPLIRERRANARRSQLDLALDVGVSARHLSFVELARPAQPELITLIADRLGVPAREQNDWLIAAGHAPAPCRDAARRSGDGDRAPLAAGVLDAHEPYPAVAIDRCWTVQLWNEASAWLGEGISAEARGDPTNIFRISLHPDGFARRTRNFDQWSAYLLRQLDLIVRRTRSAEAEHSGRIASGHASRPVRVVAGAQADEPVMPRVGTAAST